MSVASTKPGTWLELMQMDGVDDASIAQNLTEILPGYHPTEAEYDRSCEIILALLTALKLRALATA